MTGADVRLDPSPSTIQSTKRVIIRGSQHQIEAAANLIKQKIITQVRTDKQTKNDIVVSHKKT